MHYSARSIPTTPTCNMWARLSTAELQRRRNWACRGRATALVREGGKMMKKKKKKKKKKNMKKKKMMMMMKKKKKKKKKKMMKKKKVKKGGNQMVERESAKIGQ